MATISLHNSRSLLDARYKTGNCKKVCARARARVSACACACVCVFYQTR